MWQADFCTNNPYSPQAINPHAGHPQAMLTEIYIEALLVDEQLADQVWEAWDKGEIDEATAFLAWWVIAYAHGRIA